jgi:hypothetical protein
MRKLVEAVKNNVKYQNATITAISFIFDLSSTNPSCRQWLSDHLHELSWM